jgi:hypothetical protein
VLDGRKKAMLNYFPNDWAAISGLLDARRRHETSVNRP